MGSGGDVRMGKAVAQGRRSCRNDDASNSSGESNPGVGNSEIIGQVQDSGDSDEELKNGGKYKANVEAERYHNRFGDDHNKRLDNGNEGHVRQSDTAQSRGKHQWFSGPFGPPSLDLARIGLWHPDSEEIGANCEDDGYPLGPTPTSVESNNEATDEGAAGSADEGSQRQNGIV